LPANFAHFFLNSAGVIVERPERMGARPSATRGGFLEGKPGGRVTLLGDTRRNGVFSRKVAGSGMFSGVFGPSGCNG
jgi:hypothetical protein